MRLLKYHKFLENYNDIIQIGNDIFMSDSLDSLPEGIHVKHCYHKNEKIKNGDLGVFTVPINCGCSDYGDKTIYISIGKKSKIITINNTYEYLDSKGILDIKSDYISKKYNKNNMDMFCRGFKYEQIPDYTTLKDLWNKSSYLYNPDDSYYELQKATVSELIKENGVFDVLEMEYEDDLSPHQYLILNNKFLENK